jgi:hypothetical protein
MIDNEIIKALESEIHGVEYVDGFSADNVSVELLKNTLDLIARQKAEIERLKFENLALLQNRITMPERLEIVNNARDKAIREFAEKLKSKLADHKFECNDKTFEEVGNWLIHKVASDVINKLVEEMTEVNDGH